MFLLLFIPPFISIICYFILLLHPVASYYTALFLQKDCLLQTLVCPSLYLGLFPQSWSSEDPGNLTDLWNTASLRSCQSCLTVVDWNSKTKGRKGESLKKRLLSLMFTKQFLCVKAKSFLCNVKAIPRRTPFYFDDTLMTCEALLALLLTHLLRFHLILCWFILYLLSVLTWTLVAFDSIAINFSF